MVHYCRFWSGLVGDRDSSTKACFTQLHQRNQIPGLEGNPESTSKKLYILLEYGVIPKKRSIWLKKLLTHLLQHFPNSYNVHKMHISLLQILLCILTLLLLNWWPDWCECSLLALCLALVLQPMRVAYAKRDSTQIVRLKGVSAEANQRREEEREKRKRRKAAQRRAAAAAAAQTAPQAAAGGVCSHFRLFSSIFRMSKGFCLCQPLSSRWSASNCLLLLSNLYS